MKQLKSTISIILACLWLSSCAQSTQDSTQVKIDHEITKTEEEWKSELTPEEYHVLREKGTERAFTGDLLSNKEEGTYTCAGCSLELFSSDTKFKSGTGWPSFFQPITESCITKVTDNSYGMNRVEVVCSRCGGHLGHVFNDGPEPTGLRYCINSVSLDFENKKADN